MNANEIAPFGYTKSGRIRKTALKPKIALYGHTKSGRIRVNPLKSQTHNICEDCGINFDNEGWITLKYCECCDDQRRSDEECYCDQFNCEKCCPDVVYPQYKLEEEKENCEEEEKICGLCDCDLGPDSGNDIIHTSPRGYIYCDSCEDEHKYITAYLAEEFDTMVKLYKEKKEKNR